MCDRREVDHDGRRSEIVDCRTISKLAREQYGAFEFRNRKLAVGLTKGNQLDPGRYQIGRVAVQVRGQRQACRNASRRTTHSQDNGDSRLDSPIVIYFRKEIQKGIRPNMTQRYEIGCGLLRRFKEKFRSSAKRGGQFCNMPQPGTIIISRTTKGLLEKNGIISSGAIA